MGNKMLGLKNSFSKSNLDQTKNYTQIRVSTSAEIRLNDYPDMAKRNTMNILLVGAASLPITSLALPYALFFVPKSSGGSTGGIAAKDALGNDIKASDWLKTHRPGDRTLSQGLKGDPTYIVVNNESAIENYGKRSLHSFRMRCAV